MRLKRNKKLSNLLKLSGVEFIILDVVVYQVKIFIRRFDWSFKDLPLRLRADMCSARSDGQIILRHSILPFSAQM